MALLLFAERRKAVFIVYIVTISDSPFCERLKMFFLTCFCLGERKWQVFFVCLFLIFYSDGETN